MGTEFNPKTRIVIVGAGPAGLSAAWFLRQRGYREVLVLEKQARVGGLCRTITEDYHSFDLGANYVTPAYRETRRLARHVGAGLYTEREIATLAVSGGAQPSVTFRTPWQAVAEPAGFRRFVRACLRYVRLRYGLRKVIDRPGFSGVHQRPDLCRSFLDWLNDHDLGCLQTLFEIPITIMGYGYLHEIPAPHALKYMHLRTFVPMVLKCWGYTAPFIRWPKRFVLGFQRLWEALSWELNVRTSVIIRDIARDESRVAVRFTHHQQVLNKIGRHRDRLEFDYLILACPFTFDVLGPILDLSEEECSLFLKIRRYSYCLTSYLAPGLRLQRPIVGVIPLTPIGTPWAITQQMPDSSLIQFYSRIGEGQDLSPEQRDRVLAEVDRVVSLLGGRIDRNEWHTFDQWPYFEHISAADIAAGFYERLEKLQGQRRTFYVGGIMDFELVENVVAYSKHLVETRFPRV